MATKPNPFIEKAKKQAKPNPFVEKAKKRGKSAEEMAKLREKKDELKTERQRQAEAAEALRIKQLPAEIKATQAEVAKYNKAYDAAMNKSEKTFAKLDKIKDQQSDRYRVAREIWEEAELECKLAMTRLQGRLASLRAKQRELERVG